MSESALHASQLGMLFRCGVQFEYRYMRGLVRPPAVAMVVGSSVHKAREVDLIAKRDTGSGLDVHHVVDAAAFDFDRRWDYESPELDADEASRGRALVKGEAKDMAVALARLHSEALTPVIEPVHIERKIRVSVPGVSRDVEGTVDTIDRSGFLRDFKTSKAKITAADIDDSIQLPLYSLLVEVADGARPTGLVLDVTQKLKRPIAYSVPAGPVASNAVSIARLQAAERVIDSGAFAPAPPDSWQCSAKWCGYYTDCPFGARRRVSVSVSMSEVSQ